MANKLAASKSVLVHDQVVVNYNNSDIQIFVFPTAFSAAILDQQKEAPKFFIHPLFLCMSRRRNEAAMQPSIHCHAWTQNCSVVTKTCRSAGSYDVGNIM